jgi:peptidyl-prolyl cis-trans isomerase C
LGHHSRRNRSLEADVILLARQLLAQYTAAQNEEPIMAKAMARHILVKTEAEAASLKKRIAAGEAFDVLARKHSTCPSGKRGGDLGEVRPGQMVRVIDQVIFKKPLREVHGPVKSQFGYHLVQVFFRD